MKRKYAVVTGGSRGIGAEIVRALCRSGCDVIVNYRLSAESAKALCREINALGAGRAIPFCADVSDESGARRLIAKAMMEFGRLDILVNNGGLRARRRLSTLRRTSFAASWERILTALYSVPARRQER